MAVLPTPNGIVTLTTDFGSIDPYVAVMKGALLRACRHVTIIDVVHELPPQDLAAGAFVAGALVERFPTGTIHVVVVDPGVGSVRRVLAVSAANAYWLAPDNGLLTPILARDDALALAVELTSLDIVPASCTFHGRDVFAPLAGRLAAGELGFLNLGPRITDVARLPDLSTACVVAVDRFGNLLTNQVAGSANPTPRGLRIAGRDAPLVTCYSDAPAGSLVSLFNSYSALEVAIVGGNAARELGIGIGTPVEWLEVSSWGCR